MVNSKKELKMAKKDERYKDSIGEKIDNLEMNIEEQKQIIEKLLKENQELRKMLKS